MRPAVGTVTREGESRSRVRFGGDRSGIREIWGDGMAAPSGFGTSMALRDAPPPRSGEGTFTGRDPFYRTPSCIGETKAAVPAAAGVGIDDL